MTSATGYSLWLMPEGRLYNRLKGTITQLSGRYFTPAFEPHVTLLGLIPGTKEEVVSKTARLASMLQPYEIRLRGVDHLDEYFRCLFVRVEKTPEVMAANTRAREVFGKRNDAEYMPHLSLMYGSLTPVTKHNIISSIGREFNAAFEAKSIHLYLTQGEVKDWRRVREFPLS